MNDAAHRPRIGMIVPSTNLTIERLLHRATFSELFDVDIVITRLPVATIASTADSKRHFHPRRLLAAARLLADARPDVIAWTGTSAMWLGVEEEMHWMRATSTDLGIPLTSATEAILEVLGGRPDVAGISLFTPYETSVHRLVARTIEGTGVDVRQQKNLGITDNAAFATIEREQLEEGVRSFPPGEPIVVVCTGIVACFSGLDVIDSLIAVLWYAMHVATGDGVRSSSPAYRSTYDALAAKLAEWTRETQ
jgi:maleate isomerase